MRFNVTWLTEEQIKKLGFASVGKDVLLSDKTSYYNCSNISIGDHVRIDDFCIGRHSIVGSGSVILPGVTLETGVAVGALTLVKKNCKEFGIYVGNPAVRVTERKKDILRLEQDFLQQFS